MAELYSPQTAEDGTSELAPAHQQGVDPTWYDAYRTANLNYPRAFFGILPYVCEAITNSVLERSTTPAEVLESQLSEAQCSDLAEHAARRAHLAYGVKLSTDEAADEQQVTPKRERIESLWAAATGDTVTLSLIWWLGSQNAANEDLDALQTLLHEDTATPVDKLVKLIPTGEEYEQFLEQLADLHDICSVIRQTLERLDVQALARRRRDLFGEGRDCDDPEVQALEAEIVQTVVQDADDYASQYDIPDHMLLRLFENLLGVSFSERSVILELDA